MSELPFQGSRTKLERATQFIEEVRAEELKFAGDDPLSAWGQEIDGGVSLTLSWKGAGFIPGAIVGDCIHNLRTALDLMASELARLNEKADKNVYFPFAASEELFDDAIKSKNFHKCGNDSVELLKTFAPYKGGNEHLRAIHDLDIADKHTALILTAANQDFEIDQEVVLFPHACTRLDLKLKSCQFIFPNEGPLGGSLLIETLENLVQLVDGVIEAFARMVALRRI